MTMFERWSLVGVFAAIAVNIIAFLAVIWQLRLLAHQNRQSQQAIVQDHDRRRKQATLEFFATTHDRQIEFRKILPNSWSSEEIVALIQKAVNGDTDTEKLIAGYLNLYEHFAAGVRAGIFDLEVTNQMAGGRIVAMQRNYQPWIEYRRRLHGVADLYCELEWLGGRLAELRRNLGLVDEPVQKDQQVP
ncbi:MAG TPA: DUF4760 domain-containing protein [Candidatus Limnocylindrales bacterium]